MEFKDRAWRERPVRTAFRVAKSLVRKAVPILRRPIVGYDESRSRIVADLSTPLGLRLYRYGLALPEIELTRLLLRPGDLFVDGGANVGLFTLVAAARVGARGKVIAFEPAPRTLALLRENLGLSGFAWVEARAEALDARAGDRQLVAFEAGKAGFSSFRPATAAGGRIENVPTTTLDEVLQGPDRARLRVLKLDLEGAEYAALTGGRELLAQARPDLLIEVEPAHLARQGASAQALATFLRAFGYEFFRAATPRGGGVELTRVVDPTVRSDSPDLFGTTTPARARECGVRIVG